MAVRLNFSRFADACQSADDVDVAALRQRQEDNESLFKHILFDVTDTKEVSDVSTDDLLSMVDLAGYYFGGEAPWVTRIRETQKKLGEARAVLRRRVL